MKILPTLITGLLTTASLVVHADNSPSDKMTMTTTAFSNAGTMPTLYTCDGRDISPDLHWTNVPANAQSLALIISDPDAPGGTFYHWIIYNIPTSTNHVDKAIKQLPEGAITGKNDFGNTKYNGPCPPKGSSHTYRITLYALDSALLIQSGSNTSTVVEAIQKHAIEKAELTATYSK